MGAGCEVMMGAEWEVMTPGVWSALTMAAAKAQATALLNIFVVVLKFLVEQLKKVN